MEKHEEYLLSIVKYQQEIIDKYKEYIEEMIHKEIIESVRDIDIFDPTNRLSLKQISIPESTFIVRCDPLTLRKWEWLKMETPIMDYNKIVFMAQEIKEDDLKKTGSN